jgi:hypothetical protein
MKYNLEQKRRKDRTGDLDAAGDANHTNQAQNTGVEAPV